MSFSNMSDQNSLSHPKCWKEKQFPKPLEKILASSNMVLFIRNNYVFLFVLIIRNIDQFLTLLIFGISFRTKLICIFVYTYDTVLQPKHDTLITNSKPSSEKFRIVNLWSFCHSKEKTKTEHTCNLIHRVTTRLPLCAAPTQDHVTRWCTSVLDSKMACSQCKTTAGLTRTTMIQHEHVALPSCNRIALFTWSLRFSAYCLAMQNENVAV